MSILTEEVGEVERIMSRVFGEQSCSLRYMVYKVKDTFFTLSFDITLLI